MIIIPSFEYFACYFIIENVNLKLFKNNFFLIMSLFLWKKRDFKKLKKMSNENGKQPKVVKIIVLGDGSVGKTSVVARFTQDEFSLANVPTIGIDYSTKEITWCGEPVKMMIWDTAGQEQYHGISKQYIRKAEGILLFYDVSFPDTYNHIENWLSSIKEYSHEAIIPIVLIGNKIDRGFSVPKEKSNQFSAQNHIPIFYTSAKTGENVNMAFQEITRLVMQHHASHPELKKNDVVKINLKKQVSEPEKPKKKFC